MMTLAPSPIRAGQLVEVLDAVHFPRGRVLRAGRYRAVRVEGRRLVVRAALDCSRLDKRFNPSVGGDGRRITPLCGEPAEVYLEPGCYTAYAEDSRPDAL